MKLEQQQDSVNDAAKTDAEMPGWDPFQVWRTRVREPQRKAQDAPRPQSARSALTLIEPV
jgi:hypothetical protein